MVRKDLKMWIAAMILGGAVVIGLPSCDDPEVMSSLKELQEKDSISSANLEKLKTLLEKAQKKVDETEQELQRVKENQGESSSSSGSSSVDLSKIESEISGINSQLKNWKKLLQEKIDSLGGKIPVVEGAPMLEEFDERFALKDDIRDFASKSDIPSVENFVTKDDLADFSTKDDLQNFASKDDIPTIEGLPTAEQISAIQEKLVQMQLQINANGHEFVDLGLPSGNLWATCNVGAKRPEEQGDFFAWGEVEPKTEYTKENYTVGDWKQALDAYHDAATHNWGGKWRTPSVSDFYELEENCEWKFDDTKKGYKITAKNGNSIFLLANKSKSNSFSEDSGVYLCNGKCSFIEYEKTPEESYWAIPVWFLNNDFGYYEESDDVFSGVSVRPVLPKD